MKTDLPRNHVASQAHQMTLRQQSRYSLALIMLISLAILSVLAATKSLPARDTNRAVHAYSAR